jgi:tRNA-modifying protein YgfZ
MATETVSDLQRDYAAITAGAGLLDRSARGKLDVTGPDAAEYLQGQVTNDVLALAPGQACYAALLDPKAHIEADMRIFCAAPAELWLDTEPHALDAVLAHLRMYKIGRQVEIADRTVERAILSLLGPVAVEIVARAAGSAAIVATEAGVDLFATADAVPALRSALLDAGARPVGEEAADVLRVELGIPRHGVDMGPENLPGEAGIVERAVSFTKGCYIGQEPVARMYHRGRPNRRLRGLRLAAAAPAGDPVMAQGKEVGRLTSSLTSPRLGPIGLAILRREVDQGDEVLVGERGTAATVVELPFDAP